MFRRKAVESTQLAGWYFELIFVDFETLLSCGRGKSARKAARARSLPIGMRWTSCNKVEPSLME